MKKALIVIISFLIGTLVAYFTEFFFRKVIQHIFECSTFNVISLYGEDYYPDTVEFYFISFGIAFAVFAISNLKNNARVVFKNFAICILIFVVILIAFTSVDANVKLTDPLNYENGIVKWKKNSIFYNDSLALSIFSSIIPSLLRIIKKR